MSGPTSPLLLVEAKAYSCEYIIRVPSLDLAVRVTREKIGI